MPNRNLQCYSRAIGVLSILSLPALTLAGCKDKSAETDATAQQGENSEAGEGTAPASAARGTKGVHDAHFPTTIPTFRHDEGIYGHVILNDVSNLLAELGQVAPPVHKGKFDEGALRALAAMALQQRGVIAQNINLKAPMGCALLDMKKYPDAPTACAIGYKGGAASLVSDLGEQGKLEDAKGHLAAFDLDGQTLFIDDLKTHAAISVYPGAFADAREYLDSNIVKRTTGLTSNIEATLFIKSLLEKYPDEIKPLLDQFAPDDNSQSTTIAEGIYPDDAAASAKLVEALDEASKMSSGSQRKNFENATQATITVGLHGWGLQLAGALVPAEGSYLLSAAKLADKSASRDLALEIPATADAFISTYQSPASWRHEPLTTNFNTLCGVWAAMTSAAEPGACAKTITDLNTRLEPTNTGLTALFHAPIAGSVVGGLGGILRTSGDRREFFVSIAKSVSIAKLLGERATKSVSFIFEENKRTHDGVAVDRVTIAMTDDLKTRLQDSATGGDKALLATLLSSALVLERAEIEGRVIWSSTVNEREAFTNMTIDAAKGKGARVDKAMVNTIFDHHPQAQSIGAANPQVFVDIVRNIAKLVPDDPQAVRLLSQLPTDLSTDLTMLSLYNDLIPSGTGAAQVLINAEFMADAVDRVMKASQEPRGGNPPTANVIAPPTPMQ